MWYQNDLNNSLPSPYSLGSMVTSDGGADEDVKAIYSNPERP